MQAKKEYKIFKVKDLKPHPRNRTIYGDGEDVSNLVDLIAKYGLREKIIVNEDGVIVSGHNRQRALLELGIEETECEVRHYSNVMEELMDLVICNSGRRQKTRVQQLREGEAIYEIEAYKAKQRLLSVQNNNRAVKELWSLTGDEQGQTRDVVAKIIKWGTGGKSSGKDYSLGRSALKRADELRESGNDDLADIIITQINKRGSHAAYDFAYKVDIDSLNDLTLSGLRAGQISGRASTLPLKPEFDKSKKRNNESVAVEEKKSTPITKQDLEDIVQEYNAQSRGEISIEIPEMDKGYVSKTLEKAMSEFKTKVAQCMTHQREIINLEDEEKERLERIMSKFIDDFKKDKNYILGGK